MDLSILDGVPLVQLQAWLASAQQALADLNTGSKPVTVTYAQGDGTRSVTYSRANMNTLTSWIQQIQTQIAKLQGVPGIRVRRAIYPRF